jgi:hypothetical protein
MCDVLQRSVENGPDRVEGGAWSQTGERQTAARRQTNSNPSRKKPPFR